MNNRNMLQIVADCRASKKQKGFTLIELIVALALFSAMAISVTAIAVSSVKAQRRVFALQEVQETVRYIQEAMIKEIRMSKVNTNSGTYTVLNITNSDDQTVVYQFAGDKISRQIVGYVPEYLSPGSMTLTGSFRVEKESFPNPNRAKVTVVIKAVTSGNRIEEQVELNLQSSITSRSFEN